MSSNDLSLKQAEILQRAEARRKQLKEGKDDSSQADTLRDTQLDARRQTEAALVTAENKLIELEQQTQKLFREKQTEIDTYKQATDAQISQLTQSVKELEAKLLAASSNSPAVDSISSSESDALRKRIEELEQTNQLQQQRINNYQDQVSTLELKLQTHLQDHVITLQSMQQRFETLSQEKNALDQLVGTLQEEVQTQELLSKQTQEDFDLLASILQEKEQLLNSTSNENKKSPTVPQTPPSPQVSLSTFSSRFLEELNALRSNPAKYAQENLSGLSNSYQGLEFSIPELSYSFKTKEGVSALHEAIEELSRTQSLPPVEIKEGLSFSCQDLCDQNGPKGISSETCADGTTSSARLVKYGRWKGKVLEILSYGPRSNDPREVICQWLIDDGNSQRTQRRNLLNPDFSVIGVGYGVHKEFGYMAIVALANAYYHPNETIPESPDVQSRKNDLKETDDGKSYLIVSEPCRVPKSKLKLYLKEKSLSLVVTTDGNEETFQWRLPFGANPSSVKANYTESTEVEILIPKAMSTVIEGEQHVADRTLAAVEGHASNRIELEVDQQPEALLFTLHPCSCEVDVHVKVIDSIELSFESVYTQVVVNPNGTNSKKNTTRKETVGLPFTVELDRISLDNQSNGDLLVTVKKPLVSSEKVEIPIN